MTLPTLPLAQHMTPTQRMFVFFFCLFFGCIPDCIFHEFWVRPGSQKSTKFAPGAEKVRSRSELFAIFGANCRFLRIFVDLDPKNDEKTTFFSMLFRAAARFFFNPANLDFDRQAQYFGGFGDFQKNTIFQKSVAKIVFKTDRWKTS